jgi:hypothetical protein
MAVPQCSKMLTLVIRILLTAEIADCYENAKTTGSRASNMFGPDTVLGDLHGKVTQQ